MNLAGKRVLRQEWDPKRPETGSVYLLLVAKLELYNFKQKRREMALAAGN